MITAAKRAALKWIDENEGRLTEICDALWGFAELGFVEFKSANLLSDELEAHGFLVERGVADIPTAFVATYGEKNPILGVMGEYDALPGLSQKVSSLKEPVVEGAPGHGCGHNIHGTSGLGGALAVKAALEETGIPGTIKFFGCPAEEMLSGKVWMVRKDIFKGVDAVLSHHPGVMNSAKLSSSNANNAVKFHYYGKTAHAAGNPEAGRSALDAIELMNMGVNMMREHMIQDARVHYTIEAGGGQPNVVPDYARSWYLVRAPERQQLDAIYGRILKIAEAASMMTETELKVEFIKGIYNKVPNRVLSDIVLANMREIGPPSYTEEEMRFAGEMAITVSPDAKRDSLWKSKRPGWEELIDVVIDRSVPDDWNEGMVSHGSTDVADVSWLAPTMEFETATYPLGTPGHSWQIVAVSGMSIGQKSAVFAAKVIATSVLDLMAKPERLKEANDERKRRLTGRKYKSPIPPDVKPPLDQWAE